MLSLVNVSESKSIQKTKKKCTKCRYTCKECCCANMCYVQPMCLKFGNLANWVFLKTVICEVLLILKPMHYTHVHKLLLLHVSCIYYVTIYSSTVFFHL